jgi:hypothetical protein
MSNRDFGVVALGRFLAVERYYETQVSPWANQPGVPARSGPAVTPPSRARGAAPVTGSAAARVEDGTDNPRAS